jgi:quercetin dioxygenase-like cupin family protein
MKLQTSTSWDGSEISYFGAQIPQVTTKSVVIPAGGYSPWIYNSINPYVYVLEGDIEAHLGNGSVQQFTAGEAFVGAQNKWLFYTNPGDTPAKLVTFRAGGVWVPYVPPPWTLRSTQTWDGAPLQYFQTQCPEVQAMTVHIDADEVGGVHLHPVNTYVYVISGSIIVEAGDVGPDNRIIQDNENYVSEVYDAGEAFAEPLNSWHAGIGGPDGVDVLVWYTTETGYAPSIGYSPEYEIDPDLEDSSLCGGSE